ncbi:MAG TPA: DinB family protein [Flavilitoribacter sp.]|nr:DinB family protein [Flavilitoribacter sp.]HMQ88499.1 DinB family protein [Flavilitoribacter sp.]
MEIKMHFTKVLGYHQWANGVFIDALLENGGAEEIRFMSHILNAHRIWLERINGQQKLFDAWAVRPVHELRDYDAELNRATLEVLDRCDPEAAIAYKNSRGEGFENTVSEILQHVLNHSTHHRAQIAILLRQRGIAPPASDYIFYYRG